MEAHNSVGRMLDVLDTSINMFTSLDEYREEKQSNLNPYILLVYVSTLIFLFIGWVLIVQFLTPLSNMSLDIPGVADLVGRMLSINYYKAIVFWAPGIAQRLPEPGEGVVVEGLRRRARLEYNVWNLGPFRPVGRLLSPLSPSVTASGQVH